MLLLIYLFMPSDFAPVSLPTNASFQEVSLTPEGELWATSGDSFFLWPTDGGEALTIRADATIWTALVCGETIVLSGEDREGAFVTHYYDRHGRQRHTEKREGERGGVVPCEYRRVGKGYAHLDLGSTGILPVTS